MGHQQCQGTIIGWSETRSVAQLKTDTPRSALFDLILHPARPHPSLRNMRN